LLAVSEEDPMKQGILKSSILDKERYFKTYDVKERLAGDASVHYLYHHREVIPKILEEVGDVPIIIMIRNPLNRLISHYNYLPVNKLNLKDEMLREEEKIKQGFNSFWYIKALGFYSAGIEAYQSSFTNVKVIVFENFVLEPEKYYEECLSFIGAKNYK